MAKPVSIADLARKVNRITENHAGPVFLKGKVAGDDPLRRQPDITRATTLLKWSPKITLDQGLKKTIPYFREKLNMKE